MKRTQEEANKLDKLIQEKRKSETKARKLKDKIKDKKRGIEKSVEANALKERTRFLHNVQFHVIPPIRRNPFAPYPDNQENEANTPSLLVGLLSQVPDLASLIWSYLGPMELSSVLRVCSYFEKLTTSVFLAIAPQLLDLYTTGVEGENETRSTHKQDLTKIIEAHRKEQTVSTGRLLRTWFAYFREYRGYETQQNPIGTSFIPKYTFIWSLDEANFVKASEMNLYVLDRYNGTSKACLKRLKEEFHFIPERCHPIRYFNYDELCKMGIRACHGGEPVDSNNLLVIQDPDDDEIEFLHTTDLCVYSLSIPGDRSNAFFDMYEISRFILNSFYFNKRKEPVIPPLKICIQSIVDNVYIFS